ncbi:hypothetical protein D9M73_51860 [compost metagenome]
MTFPRTYGEVMQLLDVDKLPEPLRSQYWANPRVKEWTHIADRVHRAEKVSSWTQWTREEAAAYEVGDYRLFSQLRGYNEAEIEEFERYITLSIQLNEQMGDDYCAAAAFAIQQIVSTPGYEEVDGILFEMSQAASTGREYVATEVAASAFDDTLSGLDEIESALNEAPV